MQYRPETKDLLSAIQDFLIKDLLPKIESDELLSYKALVSWNMLGVVSREIESTNLSSQWASVLDLKLNLLPEETQIDSKDFASLPKKEQIKLLSDFNHKFAKYIRDKGNEETSIEDSKRFEPGNLIWEFQKNRLRENLQISNPRFQI